MDRSKLSNVTKKVDRVVQYIMTNSIKDINSLIEEATVYVAKELGLQYQRKDTKKTEPWWKRRIEGDIKILIGDINILERKRKDQLKDMRKYIDLERRYWIKGLTTVIEVLKQRSKAKTEKIKRYQQRIHQYRQNRMFRTYQKKNLPGVE